MSSASVTSSKRDVQLEKLKSEMMQELDTIRTLNSGLKAYLLQLRTYKKNLSGMNENYKQLGKVNHQWIDTLNLLKR